MTELYGPPTCSTSTKPAKHASDLVNWLAILCGGLSGPGVWVAGTVADYLESAHNWEVYDDDTVDMLMFAVLSLCIVGGLLAGLSHWRKWGRDDRLRVASSIVNAITMTFWLGLAFLAYLSAVHGVSVFGLVK